MAGPFYFAWIASGDVAFDPVTHAVFDEVFFDLAISHSEGDLATCRLTVRNPKVGLLGTERYRWAIISWHNGTDIVPLFKGRIIGVPSGVSGRLVELEFIARPDDYQDQKAAVADGLRTLPRYDPVWFSQGGGTSDNDQVLEPYSALWYIDRVTLAVSTSDIINGEAGTVELTAADHEYDGLDVSYAEKPIKRVRAKATVTWTQQGEGLLDLTQAVTIALRKASPGYSYPEFSSLTGDGLAGSWPKKDASIGEGWTVSEATITNLSANTPAVQTSPNLLLLGPASYVSSNSPTDTLQGSAYRPYNFRVIYFDYTPEMLASANGGLASGSGSFSPAQAFVGLLYHLVPAQFIVDFPVPALKGTLVAKWRAARKRTETISFVLEADLQELDNDLSLEATEETVELSSDYVGQLADAFSLSTKVSISNGSAAATLEGSLGLVAGQVYQITSDHIPFGATFTAPSNAGADNLAITLSASATDTSPDGGEDCAVETTGAYPIGDLRRNSYFRTDRGAQSFESLLYLCRAKLLAKSRAVEITTKPISWATAVGVTLQHNLIVHDDRLPGGVATGKVTGIDLTFADGAYDAQITIKCPIGKGATLDSPTEGTGSYASSGYMQAGYQTADGATVSLDVGDLQYEPFDAVVVDDDGVDLFNIYVGELTNIQEETAPKRFILEWGQSALKSITVDNGLIWQTRVAMANAGTRYASIQNTIFGSGPNYGDPIKAVGANPTTVDVKLVSMTGEFLTEIEPTVSKLMIPRSIDLEAA